MFVSTMAMGVAATFSWVVGKAAAVGEPVANASVAPVGVTLKSRVKLSWAASFAVSFSEPASGVPAVDEPGTVAVSVNVWEAPAATLRLALSAAKAAPVTATATIRALVPVLLTDTVLVTAAPPQEPGPKTTLEAGTFSGPLLVGLPPSPDASAVVPSGAPVSPTVASGPASLELESMGAESNVDVSGVASSVASPPAELSGSTLLSTPPSLPGDVELLLSPPHPIAAAPATNVVRTSQWAPFNRRIMWSTLNKSKGRTGAQSDGAQLAEPTQG